MYKIVKWILPPQSSIEHIYKQASKAPSVNDKEDAYDKGDTTDKVVQENLNQQLIAIFNEYCSSVGIHELPFMNNSGDKYWW